MAGVSTKEIKSRIRSMESTRQITKAMEMVAASKLRRAQAQISNSRPYFRILRSTIDEILAANRDFSSPYLQRREGGRALYIVVAGDRGLAGGYNSNVLKLALEQMEQNTETPAVLPIGRKAVDFFHSRKMEIWSESYLDAANIGVGDCFSISRNLSRAYLAGEFDEINLVYTDFVSVLSQQSAVMTLLPLSRQEEANTATCETLYEPDSEAVFAAVVPEYLGGILYGALCESRAAEQAARRTAMDAATQNADDMIADLSLKYNQARQAAITQEITEIVAGSL